MSDIDPYEARRIATHAQIDRWAAHLRELQRKALGLSPERAPWERTNENEEA